MRGLRFLGNRQMRIEEFADPEPGPGEVRVKIARSAVCGTDIHRYHADKEYIDRMPDGSPLIQGHEPAGWVDQVGPGVTGLTRGERVMLSGVVSCGRCRWCLQGYNTACEQGPSGLAWNHQGVDSDYVVWPAINVFKLPDSLSLDAATVLTCAGGTAYTVVRETELSGQDKLAIVGLGPVGLSLLLFAHSLGVPTIGIDISPVRLKMATELGLDCAVNANEQDVVKTVMDWSGGKGCDVVAECVGLPATQEQSLALAAMRGRVAMAGLGSGPLNFNPMHYFIGRQLKIMGIAATPLRYFHDMIDRVVSCNLPFERLITHRFPLEKAEEAFAVMESGQSGKVLFTIAEGL
jgi:threonine dehydrogenase-like Zn-dependent dehydrogenase